MRTVSFTIRYDGEALRDGDIDAAQLGTALLSTAQIFTAANLALNGKDARVKIHVRGNFRTGSFSVDFSVLQSLIDAAKGWVTQTHLSDAKELLEVLGFWIGAPIAGYHGVVQIAKKIRGRKIIGHEEGATDIVELTLDDGEKISISKKALALFESPEIRSRLADITAPLNTPGIERVDFLKDGEMSESIEKGQADYFSESIFSFEEEQLEDEVFDIWLQLRTVSFDRDLKWRFTDGNVSYSGKILDEEFWKRVQTNVASFSHGDTFKLRMKTRKTLINGKMVTTHEFIKILEIRKPPVQTGFLPNDSVNGTDNGV